MEWNYMEDVMQWNWRTILENLKLKHLSLSLSLSFHKFQKFYLQNADV